MWRMDITVLHAVELIIDIGILHLLIDLRLDLLLHYLLCMHKKANKHYGAAHGPIRSVRPELYGGASVAVSGYSLNLLAGSFYQLSFYLGIIFLALFSWHYPIWPAPQPHLSRTSARTSACTSAFVLARQVFSQNYILEFRRKAVHSNAMIYMTEHRYAN